MKTITGTYKCGHSWTTTLIRGGTKSEIQAIQNGYARKVCPKCEDSAATPSINMADYAKTILFAGRR
jgi:hypothetical protein